MPYCFKVRIRLSNTQRQIVDATFRASRYAYNSFIALNRERYSNNEKYMNGYEFKEMINELKNTDEKYKCLKGDNIIYKSVAEAVLDAHKSYQSYMNNRSKGKPVKLYFRSYKDNRESIYLNGDSIKIREDMIQLPKMKWVKLCESNYLPVDSKIISARLVRELNEYYISVLVRSTKYHKLRKINTQTEPIGIDLGVKTYATIYNGKDFNNYNNPNKRSEIKYLEAKLQQFNQIVSKKIEINKKKKYIDNPYKTNKIIKLRKRIQKIYRRLQRIRDDFIKKLVSDIVKKNPKYIAIETLKVSKMLGNDQSRKLHDAIAKCKFSYFISHLIYKATDYMIPIIERGPTYPSSQLCCKCGTRNINMKSLSERVFKCESCNNVMDRDENAAVNIRNYTQEFVVKDYNRNSSGFIQLKRKEILI